MTGNTIRDQDRKEETRKAGASSSAAKYCGKRQKKCLLRIANIERKKKNKKTCCGIVNLSCFLFR